MTQPDFEIALEHVRDKVASNYGDDACHSALISALKRGCAAFESEERLLHYVTSSARGDQRSEYAKVKRRSEVLRSYRSTLVRTIKPEREAEIDVQTTTAHLAEPFRAAVRAYLLEEATITQAANYLALTVPATTRRRWILQEVTRLLNGPLKAYYG